MKNKNIRINNKFMHVLVCIILIVLLIVIYVVNNSTPYLKVDYEISISGYCSCLTFYPNNKFSEYDCDSEPTDMPFSGEFYNEYVYDRDENMITFKSNLKEFKDVKAKVIEWTDKKLVLKVINSKYLNERCSIDGKNTYEYLAK